MARTTLKSKKTNEKLYPQTEAEIVITADGGNVEQKLRNIETKLSNVEQASDYKGYFPNETALLNKWNNSTEENPLTHEQSLERQGWYARVGAEGSSDTTMYYWDVEDKAWIKGSIVNISGVASVNNLQPDENTGNLTLTAENIPTSFTEEDGTQKSAQDVFYMLQGEHTELENEIEVLQNKTSVLYLTNSQLADAVNRLVEPYENGQVAVANDDGDYKIGSSYKFIIEGTEDNPSFRWEEITSSGGTEITDALTLSKEVIVPALNGTVTYENIINTSIKYGFTEQEDGSYKPDNLIQKYSAAMMKITFNLSRDSDIVFDFVQSSRNTSGVTDSFAYFSKIDTELPTNSYSSSDYTNMLISTKNSKGGKIIYNMPAGEHYITVKFMNGAYTNISNFRLKLITDLNQNETVKTSENIIAVNDNNNIQINNSDIITNATSVSNCLHGTNINPIKIYELESGFYKISGYYKVFSNSDIVNRVAYGDDTFLTVMVNSDFYNEEYGKKKTIYIPNSLPTTLYGRSFQYINLAYSGKYFTQNDANNFTLCFNDDSNCTLYIYDIDTTDERAELNVYNAVAPVTIENASSQPNSSMYSNAYLNIKNTKAYEPTEDYHPATKKYIDDKRPITLKEDIFLNPIENTITNSTDLYDNKLYFNKKIGTQMVETGVNSSTTLQMTKLKVDKSITTQRASSNLHGGQTIYFNAYNASGSSTSKSLSISCTDGYPYRIAFGSVILYENSEWLTDTVDVSQLGTNFEYFKYSRGSGAYLDYMPYLYSVSEEDVIEPTRIALYEDIINAGGGSSTKPITQFEEPAYVNASDYANTFGTGTGYNNQLYFYKDYGTQEVDYPLQDFLDLKMQNLRVDEAIVDKLSVSGTGTESVTFNLMLNSGDETTVTLYVDYLDGVVTNVRISPYYKEEYQYLYQDGKWNYSLIPTSHFVENADTMIYSGSTSSPILPYLSIVDKISNQGSIRIALYDDIANAGASGGYRGDYESGTWYNRGDIVSGVGEGIFYVCLVENNGIVQPEYWNEYTEFDGVRYWQNMNYNTYISMNAINAQNDGSGRNIGDTYATKEELENAVISGGGTPLPSEMVKYFEEYDASKTYSKNDMVYYSNHFFISVSDNNTGNTPNINAFYTMIGNNLYWRNMGYSATYADNATNDGDGNNISNTYVHNTTTINNKPLTSNVTLTSSDVGAVPTSRTINNKPLTSNVTLTPSDIGAVSSSSLGSAAYKTATDSFVTGDTQYESLPTVNAVRTFITAKGYATQEALSSLESGLGTQCTFVLSGTTLTITSK